MSGGARKGAGRPPKPVKLQRRTFALEPQYWECLEALATGWKESQAQALRNLIDGVPIPDK